MRPALFLLLLTFPTSLFASECSEIKVNDSMEEIIELQGLAACSMRGSMYLYAMSRNESKEIYKNFYECEGSEVTVNLERFRKRETTKLLVSDIEVKEPQDLDEIKFKKNVTNLEKLISNIEIKNSVRCTELTRLFSREQDRYFLCGRTKLRVEVSPYVKCTDSWKSL